MSILAAATGPEGLPGVTRVVYGWYFSPTDVTVPEPGHLRIRLTLPAGSDTEIPTRFLRVRQVKSYALDRGTEVTVHDVKDIRYDSTAHRLEITSPLRMRFTIDVDAVDVDVVEPEPG